jgi:phosphoribosyl-AMP cyclohydrolase
VHPSAVAIPARNEDRRSGLEVLYLTLPSRDATGFFSKQIISQAISRRSCAWKTRQMADDLEEGNVLLLDFSKLDHVGGVVPCAVQDADSREVILVAYVSEQALLHTIKERSATFWSTSRNELWEKGKTSGETFEIVEIRVNCEQNSLLYVVRPRRGGICHTKNRQGAPRNCFYRRVDLDSAQLEVLDP